MPPSPRLVTPNFLTFWTGQTLAQAGAALAQVALPVTAVQVLGATESQLGQLNAAQLAAFLLVGLPAGAWVDRWRKRRTMIVADLVRFTAALAVPVLWLLGDLALWQLYLVAALTGLASVFFDVAYQSYLPILLPDEQIAPGNSALESSAQLARIAGPGLGGALLKVMPAPLLMFTDAIGYLASAAFLLRTRDDEQPRTARADPAPGAMPAASPSLLHEIGEGIGFVARHPVIRLVTASTFVSNLCATLTFTLFPIFVLRVLELDGFEMGIALGLASAGGLVGATTAGAVVRRLGEKRTIVAGMLVAALGASLMPLAATLTGDLARISWLAASQFVMNAGVLVYNITQVSLRQRVCPRPLLGRMNASIRFVVWGVMPLSALLAGWLGTHLGTVPTIWIGAIAGWLALPPLLAIPSRAAVEPSNVTVR